MNKQETTNNSISQNQLDILKLEYIRICDYINILEGSADKVFSIFFGANGAALIYGLVKDVEEVFYITPLVIIWVLSYYLYTLDKVLTLGGYKEHLENAINKLVHKNILIWESILVKKNIKNKFIYIINRIVHIFLGLIILSLSGYKIFIINKIHFISFIVMILFILLIFIISYIKILKSCYDKALDLSNKSYKKIK